MVGNLQREAGRIQVLRGLDVLRQVGFSEEDIANMRVQFHASRGTLLDDPDQMRSREEDWVNSVVDGRNGERGSFFSLSPVV